MNRILILLAIAVIPLVGHAGECRDFSCFSRVRQRVVFPAYSSYPVQGKNFAQNFTAQTDYEYVLKQLEKAEDFQSRVNELRLRSFQQMRQEAAQAQQLLTAPPEEGPLPVIGGGSLNSQVRGIFASRKCAECHQAKGKGPSLDKLVNADRLMRSRIFVLTVSGASYGEMPAGAAKCDDAQNEVILEWSLQE